MKLNFFSDHIFDLINESDLLDVYDIRTVENGFQVTVKDGSVFRVEITRAEPADNVLQLFPQDRGQND